MRLEHISQVGKHMPDPREGKKKTLYEQVGMLCCAAPQQ
jgi:hypothetical protein